MKKRLEGIVYLVSSYGRGGKRYMKVGFTTDLSDRLSKYKTHNPEVELLKTISGTKSLLEVSIQNYLYGKYGECEWMTYKQEFVDKFSLLDNEDKFYRNDSRTNRTLVKHVVDHIKYILKKYDLD